MSFTLKKTKISHQTNLKEIDSLIDKVIQKHIFEVLRLKNPIYATLTLTSRSGLENVQSASRREMCSVAYSTGK